MRSVTGADGCAGYHRLMDIDQARTFLAVAHHGSFVAASESLHITQTAVSARIRQLETQLDARLFVRDKTGARMTAAGERFVKYATAIVGQWEDARQQVGVPRGRAKVMRVGGEPSLWSPLLVDWLVWMKRHCSDAAVRVEVEVADRLVERVQQGTLDLAVVYGPPQRPNLIVELLAEEKLVMVTTSANGRWQPDSYVHVDWGAAFTASSRAAFPEIGSPTVSSSLGPLALHYLAAVGGSGYFRAGAAAPHLAAKTLFRVPRAPEFSHSVYAVYAPGSNAGMVEQARLGLKAAIAA